MQNELFIVYEKGILEEDVLKIHNLLDKYVKYFGKDFIKSGKITEDITCFYIVSNYDKHKHKHTGYNYAFNYNKDNFKNIPSLSNCDASDIDAIINNYYMRYERDFFEELGKYMSFSSVIYDSSINEFIAGIVNGEKSGFKLFKGILKNNKEVYSNSKEILNEICSVVYEIPDNSYVVGDKIYSVNKRENEYTRKLWCKLKDFVENNNK